jgi:hypothetical protein
MRRRRRRMRLGSRWGSWRSGVRGRDRYDVVPTPRGRRRSGSGQTIFAGRGKSAVDLRFEQDVVRAADHHQMLDVVAADKNKLPLSVEAEGVHQPKPGLARPSAWDPQPVGEHEPVDNRQRHQGGDPASRQKSDLNDSIVAERKVIQPLHSDSHACAADCASLTYTLPPPQVPPSFARQRAKLHAHRGRPLKARGFDASPTSAQDEPDRNHNKTCGQ